MTNPPIKHITTPEGLIPHDKRAEWVAFLLTLPVIWWDDKTPEQRGAEAFRMWKESNGQ
jgi:hypothetical protein